MDQNFDKGEVTKTGFLLELLRDPERKSLFRMFYEFVFLYLKYWEYPGHYFSRYLFKKDKTNILDYYPWKYLYGIKKYFIDREVREVLENKLFFDLYYRRFGIALPEILMFNHRKIFAVGARIHEVKSAEEFTDLLEDILTSKADSDSVIIKRTYWSYGGAKIYKVYRDQVRKDPVMIRNLYETIIKSGYLFQNVIKQHSQLNNLNPSCLNTMRIDTFINPDGKIDVISAYIRMSYKNAYVDNISSGGLLVGIDIDSGRLKKEGFSNLKDVGVKIFKEHPVTKTVFEGFTIPFFDKAKELVVEAARLMPGLRLVGWDVAISEEGPVIVEGNSDYDNTGNDLSEGGFRTNAIFRKILEEYKILKKAKKSSEKRP